MSVIRIAFLGTPAFAHSHLQSLLSDEHFQVVGVVTQPDRPAGRKMQPTPSPVKQLAESHQIPVLSPPSVNQSDVLQEIAKWRAEAAVVVAFGQIVSQEFLDLFPNKVVNVHASLLPRWRGAAPIQRAIMAGDTETGVTLQVMTKKLDAGGILGVRKVKLDDQITAVELHDQLKKLGAELLAVEFMDYLRGNLTPTPQDESLVTYAKKIEKGEAQIDWSEEAVVISRKIRGLTLGPGTFTHRQGKILKIHRAQVIDNAVSQKPGAVIRVAPDHFVVACGRGALKVLEVQPESKARQLVSDYLKGYVMHEGELLGTPSNP